VLQDGCARTRNGSASFPRRRDGRRALLLVDGPAPLACLPKLACRLAVGLFFARPRRGTGAINRALVFNRSMSCCHPAFRFTLLNRGVLAVDLNSRQPASVSVARAPAIPISSRSAGDRDFGNTLGTTAQEELNMKMIIAAFVLALSAVGLTTPVVAAGPGGSALGLKHAPGDGLLRSVDFRCVAVGRTIRGGRIRGTRRVTEGFRRRGACRRALRRCNRALNRRQRAGLNPFGRCRVARVRRIF